MATDEPTQTSDKDPEDDHDYTPTWKELILQYTQDTSAHGVPYITSETRFPIRRVIWFLAWLAAVCTFSYLLIARLIQYYDYPKAVNVEVTYETSLPFPAVTLCNQNLFRLSQIQALGLYDEVLAQLDLTIRAEAPDLVSYTETAKGCLADDYQPAISGKYYVEITLSGYDSNVLCTLEDTMCTLSQTEDDGEDWRLIQASLDGAEGGRDHTTGSKEGHMYYTIEIERAANSSARLITAYKRTDGFCIELYYWLRGASVLEVKIRGEDYVEHLLTRKVKQEGGRSWQWLYGTLPGGVNQVIIDSYMIAGVFSGVLIDDIFIQPCTDFLNMCKRTISGAEFMGAAEHAKNGLPCNYWESHPGASFPYGDSESNANFCRLATNDEGLQVVSEPWCYTERGPESCAIPYCNCSSEFNLVACLDGQCVPRHLLCDGTVHCQDGSDEHELCADLISISCTFNQEYVCGYRSAPLTMDNVMWTRKSDGDFYGGQSGYNDTNVDYLKVDITNAHVKSYAVVTSPQFDPTTLPYCLTFEFRLWAPDYTLQTSPHPALEIHSRSDTHPLTGKREWYSRQSGNGMGYVTFFPNASLAPMHIDFVGIVGDPDTSVIQIANVHFVVGYCDEDLETNILEADVRCWMPDFWCEDGRACYPDVFMCDGDPRCDDGSDELDLHCANNTVPSNGGENLPRPYGYRTTYGDFIWKIETKLEAMDDGIKAVDGGCNTTFTASAGVLTSPNYPDVYPSHTYCDYYITQPNGASVYLELKVIRMPDRMPYCNKGFVQILKLSNNGNSEEVEETFCGDETERTITPRKMTVGSQVRVKFQTYVDLTNKGFLMSYETDRYRNSEPVFAAKLLETAGSVEDLAFLRTPDVISVTSPKCLSFRYFMASNLELKSTSPNETKVLMDLEVDGGDTYHLALVDLPYGEYQLLWEVRADVVKFDRIAKYRAAIYDIRYSDSHCSALRQQRESLSCQFTDDHICGWNAYMGNVLTWSRVMLRTHDDVMYLLAMGVTHTSTVGPQITTPWHDTPSGCLLLVLGCAWCAEGFEIEVVVTYGSSPKQSQTFSDGLLANHYIQRTLSVNNERFRATIKFLKIKTGYVFIREAEVQASACPSPALPLETPMDAAHINETFNQDTLHRSAVSSETHGHAEQEMTSYLDKVPAEVTWRDTESLLARPAQVVANQGMSPSSVHDINYNGDPSLIDDMVNFYKYAGHQMEDFIYTCTWDGVPCSNTSFTTAITDQGLCYTFNSDRKYAYDTSKTGAGFGLSLIVNIEQYEYISGPNTDAGIKVYLHEQNDVPQIKNLGFAVSPGVHSLVAAKYSRHASLGPPYGTCGESSMYLYETGTKYTYSRCTEQCGTGYAEQTCGCVDAYMPGDEPVCNLTQYLSCLVDIEYVSGFRFTNCHCPDACGVKSYGVDLSYAALSTLSVDSLLEENTTDLSWKYHRALEIEQRVLTENMKDTVENLQNLIATLNTFSRLTVDKSPATLGRVNSALMKINQVARSDIIEPLELTLKYQSAYRQIYHDLLSGAGESLRGTKVVLGYLDSKCPISEHRPAVEALHTTHGNIENTLTYLLALAEIKNIPFDDSLHDWLPETFWSSCPVSTVEDKYRKLGRDLISTISEIEGSNSYSDRHITCSEVAELLSGIDNLIACVKEYPETLEPTIDTIYRTLGEVDATLDDIADFSFDKVLENAQGDLIDIQHKANWLEERLLHYSQNTTTKIDLSKEITPETLDETLQSIDNVIAKIDTHAVSKLLRQTELMKINMKMWVHDVLEALSLLVPYVESRIIDGSTRAMSLWRLPFAQMDIPQILLYKYIPSDAWKVWPRSITTVDFLKLKMDTEIMGEIVEAYADTLYEEIYQIQLQFTEARMKIVTAFNNLITDVGNFKKRSVIGKDVVLKNFLVMDVYFAALKFESVEQVEGYGILNFLSEVGGFMGLLLGASTLTLFEILDLFIYNTFLKLGDRRHKKNFLARKAARSTE